jgi:DNA polymerase III alpha subunit
MIKLWQLIEQPDGEFVETCGVVTKTLRATTKRGEPMMFARLEDRFGVVVVVLVPAVFRPVSHIVSAGAYLHIRGRVDQHDPDDTKLVARDVALRGDMPPTSWVTS